MAKNQALRWSGALAVVAAAALFGSACEITVDAGPYSAHEDKRFQVNGTPDLSLTTFDGSVEVRSWDRNEVLIEIEKRAADKTHAEAIPVSAEQSGNTITVEVKKPDGPQASFGFRVSPSARIVASVPAHCNLIVRSEDGSIRIERVEGKIDLRSGDGSLTGIDLTGTVRAHTGDGTLTYQWQKNSANLSNGGHYSGCTTATLTISNASTNDSGAYHCVVTGGCGSAISSDATVTCAAPPPPLCFESAVMLPQNQVRLVISGEPGSGVTIHRSRDLAGWSVLTNLVNTNGVVEFIDTTASNAVQRFYRATSP